MPDPATVVIRPQPGPQERFLASPADIAFYGGAAGGGKSWALLLEALRNTSNPQFGSTIFRRTRPNIMKQGGLWDESMKLYPLADGVPHVGPLQWRFPGGAKVEFGYMLRKLDVLNWKGSAVAMMGWDEVSEFDEYQFEYMLSRNRSTSGVKPYIRATTNPVPDDDPIGGWLHKYVGWWIDQETGHIIPDRCGRLRWFVRADDSLVWADSAEELRADYPDDEPMSFTFIEASLDDNPMLTKADPSYRSKLRAMPLIERMRLLDRNWKVRARAGMVFEVDKFEIVDHVPAKLRCCRAWDLAATKGDGDWTAGVKMGVDDDGTIYVLAVDRGQWESGTVRRRIQLCAETDTRACRIRLPQDPGQAGKDQGSQFVRMLAGYSVKVASISGDKLTRSSGYASAVNGGIVKLLRGSWNKEYIDELDAFGGKPQVAPDDQVDASADAYNDLVAKRQFVVA
jgi:predicted phage terminase large subunit-like protein